MNHAHIDDKAMETALAISNLKSGKDLPDPYKDHPFHQGPIDEETPIFVAKQDSSSEDEEEQTKAEPNLDTYNPHVPYPQALNHPRTKVNELDGHLLEYFLNFTVIIPPNKCH